jgi:hypothetical protein
MGYRYGRKSLAVKATLHPMFHAPLDDIIKIVDITLTTGARDEPKQNEKFNSGASQVRFPGSAHNILKPGDPSFAFDGMPYTAGIPGGIDWRTGKELFKAINKGDFTEAYAILENIKRIRHTAGIIIGVFHAHGIPLINGADWDGDNKFNDQKFIDSPHYQHKNWRALRDEL